MLPRFLTLSSIASLSLIVLMVVPVNAAPSLNLGSNASYHLSLNFSEKQSCSASPLAYNQTACGPPPIPQLWTFRDDFNYTSISQLQAAGWTIETIAPASYYSVGNSTLTLLNDGHVGAGAGHNVPPGSSDWSVSTRVEWIGSRGNVSGSVGSLSVKVQTVGHSYGWLADGFYGHFYISMDDANVGVFSNNTPRLFVWHVLRLDMIGGNLYGYFDGSLVGSYSVANATPGSTDLVNIQALASWETNNGFDWMEAHSLPPTPVAVQATPPSVSLSGNLGWTVVGLDSSTAVLNVTHALSVLVDNIPISPVSETGSFQDSVNLTTRAESQGTTAEMVKSFGPLLALLTSASSGTTPFATPSLLPSSLPTMYTIWWINGPVSNGSPVQILSGYSSVQGSETVSLPGSLGSRGAWTVTSNIAESVSTIVPQLGSPTNPTSISGPLNTNNALAKLVLKFDYDQSSDLLLASADTATVTSTSSTLYPQGSLLCGQFGLCITVSVPTTITHVTTLIVAGSLTLSSTNLNLANRMGGTNGPSGSGMLSQLTAAMAQPVLVMLVSVAAGLAVVIALVETRLNSQKPPMVPAPSAPTIQ